MSNTNDGGPAFPTENERQTGTNSYHFMGMSLRDYFAAKAMQAMVSAYRITKRGIENAQDDTEADLTMPDRRLILDENHKTGEYDGAAEIAIDAYIIADAMIAARGGGK